MAPAGRPRPGAAPLARGGDEALRDPEVAPRLEAAGYAVVAGSPDDYAAFQRAEIGPLASRGRDRRHLAGLIMLRCSPRMDALTSPNGRMFR